MYHGHHGDVDCPCNDRPLRLLLLLFFDSSFFAALPRKSVPFSFRRPPADVDGGEEEKEEEEDDDGALLASLQSSPPPPQLLVKAKSEVSLSALASQSPSAERSATPPKQEQGKKRERMDADDRALGVLIVVLYLYNVTNVVLNINSIPLKEPQETERTCLGLGSIKLPYSSS